MLEDEFIYWIRERENIRKRKELGEPAPWSTDKVFQETYFCNVRREDDRVTKWIRQHFILCDYIFSEMAMCRFFNRIETIKNLPTIRETLMDGVFDISDWECDALDVLGAFLTAGEKIWGSAYIVSTNGKKIGKVDYILGLIKAIFAREQELQSYTTCADAHKALMESDGMGSFMAAQVIADVKNTKGSSLYNAPDKKSFSAHGPGSLRGLAWFYQREKVSPKEYQGLMDELWDIVEDHCFLEEFHLNFDMQDLQNCLCEFDKYMRVSTGSGRSKRKYQPKETSNV